MHLPDPLAEALAQIDRAHAAAQVKRPAGEARSRFQRLAETYERPFPASRFDHMFPARVASHNLARMNLAAMYRRCAAAASFEAPDQ